MLCDPPDAQKELKQLALLFENALAGLIVLDGHLGAFTALPGEAQDKVLLGWRDSSMAVRRTGYSALRKLTQAAYTPQPILLAAGEAIPARRRFHKRHELRRRQPTRRRHQARRRRVHHRLGRGRRGSPRSLQSAGLKVLVLEEGGHHTKAEFKMREDLAFPMLYQEGGQRATKDLGIAILQGRAVGGTTVVNWTTSFRTPAHVLEHWQKVHGVSGLSKAELDPHWDSVEERLNIKQVGLEETNRNNRTLYDGCKALGLAVDTTFRNTRNCFKSGYCGMGCPVDAKQSMLVTYLPDAVDKGATVLSRCRVDKLVVEAGRVARVECSSIGADGYAPTGRALTVTAKHFILSAGAINSPAILMRSGLGGGLVGRRTFLHPVVGTAGRFKDPIEPFYGAPQSVASHALADRGDKVGLFIEAAPLHPMLGAISTTGFGPRHHETLKMLPNLAAHLALAIDGFHPSEEGGTVQPTRRARRCLDYTLPPRIAWKRCAKG